MYTRRAIVVAAVVVLHGLVLVPAWFERLAPPRPVESVLTVAVVSAPSPTDEEKPPALPPVHLVAPAVLVDAPEIAISAADVAPAPIVANHPAPPAPAQAITENLGTELVVQCPERTPPHYPPLAKRQREQGEVRLRVELDESGRIDRVTIIRSSGSPRLDEAARTAIESWRCRPARHDGKPVRAVAMKSLDFVLERR